MNKAAIIMALAIIIIVTVAFGTFFLFGSKFKYTQLSSKPNLEETIVKNPDISFPGHWGSFFKDYIIVDEATGNKNNQSDWHSNGWYTDSEIWGRKGIVILDPVDPIQGRFIKQHVYLLKGSYTLLLGIANIAGSYPDLNSSGCDEVGFRVKTYNYYNKKENLLLDTIVNSKEKWKDLSINFKTESDGETILMVESYHGGHCDSLTDWAAIDYLDILKE